MKLSNLLHRKSQYFENVKRCFLITAIWIQSRVMNNQIESSKINMHRSLNVGDAAPPATLDNVKPYADAPSPATPSNSRRGCQMLECGVWLVTGRELLSTVCGADINGLQSSGQKTLARKGASC